MAQCPSYGCSDLADYDPGNACATYKGGASQLALIKCGVVIEDLTDGTEINEAITAGDIILIENVKLNWETPSEVTVDPLIACFSETVAAYDHEITFIDRNVTPATISFYNSANASTGLAFGGALIYECDADRVTHIDVPLQIVGGRVLPDQNNALQFFDQRIRFRSTKGSMPILASKPVGVFD